MKRFLISLAVMAATLTIVPVAGAVDISVNTTVDDYANPPTSCSLREAITSAQTNSAFGGCPAGLGTDTIRLPAGNYKITRAGANDDANVTGDFDVTGLNSLIIEAASADAKVVIDANQLDRAFDQQDNNNLTLKNLQAENGKTTLIGDDGGGVRNAAGNLSLEGVTVSGNTTAYSGGGIAVYSNLTALNSTISGNSAVQNGGGLYMPGGSLATVRSSTITRNTADSNADDNGEGGGFYDNLSNGVNFFNVIDASNVDSSPAIKTPDCYSNSTKFFPRFTISVQALGAGSCLVGFDPGSNIAVPNAGLGTFGYNNGGQTPTFPLLEGSPAVGTGGKVAPDICPTTDQNGNPRPADECDIGAVQYVKEPDPPVDTFGVKFSKVKPKALKLKRGKQAKAVSVTVASTGTAAATGVKVCVRPGKKARKAIKKVGRFCKKVGTLSAGKTVKFKFKARKKAKKKLFKLKVVMTSTNAAQKTGVIKIRVR